MKSSKLLLLSVGLSVIGLVGLLILGIFSFSNSATYNNFMNMSNMMNGNGGVLTSSSVSSLQQKATTGTINKSKNSITFTQSTVNLVVLAAPPGRSGEYFEIDNLINPTLIVKTGTTINLTLVNEDNEMHGFEIVNAQPPFSRYPMMSDKTLFNSFIMPIWGTNTNSYYSSNTTITASSSGSYTYLCPVPGHAQMGMYGKIVIG